MNHLSDEQRTILLKPINPKRVLHDNKGMAHLPAYDVVAHLTRCFGFEGWDKEILTLQLVCETLEDYERNGQPKKGYNVTYSCTMRLTIRSQSGVVVKTIDDGATGSANHMPSRGDAHDFAMKNAISYAIKRCAKDLGDQFGLSLYNKGQVAALLQQVVPYLMTTDGTVDDEVNITEPQSLGNDEREPEDES